MHYLPVFLRKFYSYSKSILQFWVQGLANFYEMQKFKVFIESNFFSKFVVFGLSISRKVQLSWKAQKNLFSNVDDKTTQKTLSSHIQGSREESAVMSRHVVTGTETTLCSRDDVNSLKTAFDFYATSPSVVSTVVDQRNVFHQKV